MMRVKGEGGEEREGREGGGFVVGDKPPTLMPEGEEGGPWMIGVEGEEKEEGGAEGWGGRGGKGGREGGRGGCVLWKSGEEV